MRRRPLVPFARLVLVLLAAACHRRSAPIADTALTAPTATVSGDTAGKIPFDSAAADSVRRAKLYATIRPKAVNAAVGLPTLEKGDSTGPDILRLQIMLDGSGFSAGIMDGHWGHNTTSALVAFQSAAGLPTTGLPDSTTMAAVIERYGDRKPIVRYVVTDSDVAGPFVKIPSSPYDQAKLPCMCYQGPVEEMAERFHATPDLLDQLNDGNLGHLAAGRKLWVPNVVRPTATAGLARLIISKTGGHTEGVDSAGRVLFHFPSTLGSQYDPSPTGKFRVTEITRNPEFHYNPKLYADVPDTKPDAYFKPGPNSAVGVVWMSLSQPHYGIHGTPHPETIGYADSHGCVRLTNWDAEWLSERIRPGTRVEFR